MKFKERPTIGETYGPAMLIQTKEEADAYLEELVLWSMKTYGNTREEATAKEKSNIGYYAGYHGDETAARVMRLFECSHPIFGTARPTVNEALRPETREGDALLWHRRL